ncbi:MAG: hypothetical protein GY859_22230, partial [Desulfobacterales bacterium]|nr:hypothetical protein [Desulfobacterales bacterium]
VDGSVEIHPGIRGDCNSDSSVDVSDLIAVDLEITDGDDSFWLSAPGGTFPGDPMGCDANGDTTIDAGDLSCASRLIFGLSCNGEGYFSILRGGVVPKSGAWANGMEDEEDFTLSRRPPRLELAPRLAAGEAGVVAARIHFAPGDYEINSVVFSLDINEDVLRFDSADRDGSGAPDAVRFIGARSARRNIRRTVRFDAGDKTGELDFIIADLTRRPGIIEKGVLVEIEFRLVGPV